METTQLAGMPLQGWANTHQPDEQLCYKDGYWQQIMFVRDKIPGLLAKTHEEYEAIQRNMQVISEHTSKSVRLPVFRILLKSGAAFTMRYNFYNWKVSVSSPRAIEIDFMGLFDPKCQIHKVHCEGFPEELVYGSYAENQKQFTLELKDNYHLFTFFWIFGRHEQNSVT